MASMRMELVGLNEILAKASRPIDFTPAIKGIKTTILVPETMENFQGQHDPDGNPWKPLKRERRRKRDLVRGKKRGRAKKGVDQILLDTGILRRSITGRGEVKASDRTKKENVQNAESKHVEEMTPDSLVWGTAIEYGVYHQNGTKFIPARPFLGINQQMTDDIAELVGEFVEGQLT